MAQSDSTGWGRHVDAGTFRLLVTFGDKRTRWNAPTAQELGYGVVSYSPYGIVGPKGMEPGLMKTLHDVFKKVLDDPEHLKVLAQLDQVYRYKSSADFAQWAAETHVAERATLERVGLLAN
jgi:tripartite-type tricarboxylate transporter receptor subunit TctC